MSDDELFLPDAQNTPQKPSVLDSFFEKPQSAIKKDKWSLEDLLANKLRPASAPVPGPTSSQISAAAPAARRKPTVKFSDPPVSSTKSYDVDGEMRALSPAAQVRAMPLSSQPAPSKAPSAQSSRTTGGASDLLDSLFKPVASRRQRQETSTAPVSQQQSPKPPDAAFDTDFFSSPHSDAIQSSRQSEEVQRLRDEIEQLKDDNAEQKKIIEKLRKQFAEREAAFVKTVQDLTKQHSEETNALNSAHQEAVTNLQHHSDAIKTITEEFDVYQGSFTAMRDQIQTLQSSMELITGQLESIKIENHERGDVVEYAQRQITDANEKMKTEVETFNKTKDYLKRVLETEFQKLEKTYTIEVINGREWLQKEKDKLLADRLAFQEEQFVVLKTIEEQKDEIEKLRCEFIKKEHDLLVRVMNEHAMLQQSQREFILQRNADVLRLRKEAEELEACFGLISDTLQSIEMIRQDYEEKNKNFYKNIEHINSFLPSPLRQTFVNLSTK